MIAIRSNFFYTRTVPCELWFLNKAKPKQYRDKALMIDARGIYTKVTRKIYDFSPEQLKNISAIVWLYRGECERFVELLVEHLGNCVDAGQESLTPVAHFMTALVEARAAVAPFFKSESKDERAEPTYAEFESAAATLDDDVKTFSKLVGEIRKAWATAKHDMKGLKTAIDLMGKSAETSHDLIRQLDHVSKLLSRAVDLAEKELGAKDNGEWSAREVRTAMKALDEIRTSAVQQLKLVRYFHRHALWLHERFPDAELRDIEGLVKLVSHKELEKNDWSLTPGRYVGVAKEEEDGDFDFEEMLREIHVELQDLTAEAVELATKIAKNFEALGI